MSLASSHQIFLDFANNARTLSSIIGRTIIARTYNSLPDKGPFTIDMIAAFITQLHSPFTLLYEGGWADNKNDNGGATMRGVTLKTFRRTFEKLFDIRPLGINNQLYINAYLKVMDTDWQSDDKLGKDFLYTLLNDKSVAQLFIIYFYTKSETGPAVHIATYDPYIAFLIVEKTWLSGGYAWSNSIQDGSIYSAAKKMGYDGPTPHYAKRDFVEWIAKINSTSLQTPVLAQNLLQAYVNHVHGIVEKHASQKIFLDGWLNRIVGKSSDTRLSMLSINAKWIKTLQNIS